MVIQPQYDEANAFYDGLAKVCLDKEGGIWGYIDKAGKMVWVDR